MSIAYELAVSSRNDELERIVALERGGGKTLHRTASCLREGLRYKPCAERGSDLEVRTTWSARAELVGHQHHGEQSLASEPQQALEAVAGVAVGEAAVCRAGGAGGARGSGRGA